MESIIFSLRDKEVFGGDSVKMKAIIIASLLTVIVGAVVFGKAALEGRSIDRTEFGRDKLRVLSYSTFVSSFGPGPELARRFKQLTGVDVELVNIGDSGLIIQKLVEDDSIYADVILGLDRLHLKEAGEVLGWKPLPRAWKPLIQKSIQSTVTELFVPVTWAPMTFLFRKSEIAHRPTRLQQLLETRDEIVSLQDPRLSTPGTQFLFWWHQLKRPGEKNIDSSQFRISPSWSQSYGLFKRDAAQMVFTYMTSIIFHWEVEKDSDFDFFLTEEGHPWQVELAGISDRCRRCTDAEKFIRFLLEPESQTLMMEKNYMFPAVSGVQRVGAFAALPDVKLLSYDQMEIFLEGKPDLEKVFFETFQ